MNRKLEISNLYRIIPLDPLRKTTSVDFDAIPMDRIESIDAIDRVKHDTKACSPGKVGDVDNAWYMHPNQIDHLMVMNGLRTVDLYTKEFGSIKTFEITPDEIRCSGETIHQGPALVSWSTGVFHRVISGEEGSLSINLATRFEDFDIRTNFNIYDLDTSSGTYTMIREGHLDQ